jgi:hypothetical protein
VTRIYDAGVASIQSPAAFNATIVDVLTDVLLNEPFDYAFTVTRDALTQFRLGDKDSRSHGGRLQPETPWGNLTNLLHCDKLKGAAHKLHCEKGLKQLQAERKLPQRAGRHNGTTPSVPKSPRGSAEVLRHQHGSGRPDNKHPSRPHHAGDGAHSHRKPYPQPETTPAAPSTTLYPQTYNQFNVSVLNPPGGNLDGLTGELTNYDIDSSGWHDASAVLFCKPLPAATACECCSGCCSV